MYAIYETATGELKSTGTVLGNNLPDTLTVIELNETDSQKLRDGSGLWNKDTLSVIDNPNYTQPVEELFIPAPALNQLKADMQDPNINSIAEIKTSIKSFADQIKQ